MNVQLFPDISTPADIKLAEHAEVIRTLGKRAIRDIIEIGRRLTDAKAIAGHGNWLPWLEKEFGWGERTARNFMQVHELASKSAKFADLTVDASSLYLLAAPSTPDEVRDHVEQLVGGKHVDATQLRLTVAARQIQASALVGAGVSLRKAAKQLGVDKRTIGRDMGRNAPKSGAKSPPQSHLSRIRKKSANNSAGRRRPTLLPGILARLSTVRLAWTFFRVEMSKEAGARCVRASRG